MLNINYRTSSCIQSISVNPLTGTCTVVYKNAPLRSYTYKNVSRRAILNIIVNPSISLGFWVNRNLLSGDTKVALVSYA